MKKTISYMAFALMLILIITMGWATWQEHLNGIQYTLDRFYRAPWFNLLWSWLALTGGYYILKTKLYKKLPAFTLHLSFLIILTGALITRFNGKTGHIHLRENQTSHIFLCDEEKGNLAIPFFLTLKNFNIEYYPGTSSPANYISIVSINDKEKGIHFEQEIAMNKILKYRGYRFYQSSFDEDLKGSILSVNYDPTGIVLTYIGYFLLFISMIWILFDRRGRFSELLKITSDSQGQTN